MSREIHESAAHECVSLNGQRAMLICTGRHGNTDAQEGDNKPRELNQCEEQFELA